MRAGTGGPVAGDEGAAGREREHPERGSGPHGLTAPHRGPGPAGPPPPTRRSPPRTAAITQPVPPNPSSAAERRNQRPTWAATAVAAPQTPLTTADSSCGMA